MKGKIPPIIFPCTLTQTVAGNVPCISSYIYYLISRHFEVLSNEKMQRETARQFSALLEINVRINDLVSALQSQKMASSLSRPAFLRFHIHAEIKMCGVLESEMPISPVAMDQSALE